MQHQSNILIADDEAIAAMSLRLELKRAGFPLCQIVATGEKAVSAALQEPFDAILMDVHLAGKINGLEAVRQIRAAGLDIPVIFISGYADQEHRAQTVEFHPAAYLVKPILMHELIRVLGQIVGRAE
jgi:CheY-like chemotaxis protein